ncbi:MAG: arginine--tRNA ligase [Actinomycetota bacterium]|nr:arginine--tRNA ligase [Actinomycetota bacterium]
MTPAELSDAVLAAVRRSVDAGELTVAVPDRVLVERPKSREHGDYATNVALQLAKPAGRAPRDVAALIAGQLLTADGVAGVDVAGPGFLNITLADDAIGTIARTVLAAGPAYGRSDLGAGERINLEFVSANPTGPLTLASARWAAVGDALARIWQATGRAVTREYYFNDAGGQIDRFAESLYARATGGEVPEGGYQGEYVADLAQQVLAEHPGLLDAPRAEAVAVFGRDGIAVMLGAIKATLTDFGLHFDVWFSERTLHDSGAIEQAIERLREQGHLYEADEALWLRTTEFGDDKDRVLVKRDGVTTYFAADAAYYMDKRRRGADRVVIMLGADHSGYVARLKAMAACFGDPPDLMDPVIGQLVNLFRGGEPVRMSKRTGTFVSFEDLVDAVGVDAARYSLVRASIDSTLDLDLDLITRRDAENPVFYVQYAHARICSLLRNATDLGVARAGSVGSAGTDFSLLSTEREGDLLRALGELPRVVASAADLRAPHRVARYLEELAGTYHRFYDACRVLPQGDEVATALTEARLALCEATRVVLANGLDLLGVSAPARM